MLPQAIALAVLTALVPARPGAGLPAGIVRTNGEAPMTAAELQAQLAGTAWKVTALGGADIPIPAFAVPTLEFGADRVEGFAGCNRFGALLSYGEGGALDIGEARVTRMACGPEAMKVEMQVLRALQRIDAVAFDGADRILLSGGGVEFLRAERAAPAE